MKERFLRGLIACAIALVPTSSFAVTYVWENVCDEDQIANSGVLDGSTDSTATGQAHFRLFDPDPSDVAGGFDERVFWDITYVGLEGLLEKIHVHGPALAGSSNPGHILDVFSNLDEITAFGADRTTDRIKFSDSLFSILLGSGGLTTGVPADHLQFMLDGLAYTNIHTDLWPMGEIRCQLSLVETIATGPMSKGQAKCTKTLGKGLEKVLNLQNNQVCKCIKKRTKGKEMDPEACTVSGPPVGKAQTKSLEAFIKQCNGNDKDGQPNMPDFGVTHASVANAVGVNQSLDIVHDVFGPDLNVALDDGSDKELSTCQATIANTVKKCHLQATKEYNKCVNADLQGKVDLPIVDEHGFENCLELDRKGKIAKACDSEVGKIRAGLDKKCAGTDIALAAPGCATSDPATAAECLESAVRCQVCLSGNATNGVSLNCDLHDDGLSNTSCL